MKLAVTTLILIALFALPARAQVLCFSHDRLVEYLDDSYSEKPVGVGVATTGGLVEVFASKAGTWTIVITAPSGVSCIRTWGDGWSNLTSPVAAEGRVS